MGCAITSTKRSRTPAKKLSSRQISITPGMFVRISQNFNYSDYVETNKLGSGAFAQVMLCLHKPTKSYRAVKLIHKSGISPSQKSSDYMLTEIQILKSLDHPNILKCFEIFQDDRMFYVSTEYCPAGDLFSEIVKMKSFTESQCAEIMLQLLSAMVYCHEKRVIHRDLKPENILLMEKGENLSIKVADFGSSVILDPNATLSGCYGSAYYLAPEVFSPAYKEKCDIWSAGIIMYILLTGRPPYSGRDSETIMNNVKRSPFVLTPNNCEGISNDAAKFLKLLLKIDPQQRISAKEAMKNPWILKHKEKILTDTQVALKNLQDFNSKSKLKEAVHIFIAAQVSSHQDIKYFQECFMKIDKDGDGRISKDELIQEYSKFMTRNEAENVAVEVIQNIDQDADGMIEYTEFLVSCLKKQKKMSFEDLELAFKMFDADGNGSITLDEIRAVLDDGEIYDEELWKELLKEADKDGDGVVDMKEFISLMSVMKSMHSLKSMQNLQSVKTLNFQSLNIPES